jgi:hypothetical protein
MEAILFVLFVVATFAAMAALGVAVIENDRANDAIADIAALESRLADAFEMADRLEGEAAWARHCERQAIAGRERIGAILAAERAAHRVTATDRDTTKAALVTAVADIARERAIVDRLEAQAVIDCEKLLDLGRELAIAQGIDPDRDA